MNQWLIRHPKLIITTLAVAGVAAWVYQEINMPELHGHVPALSLSREAGIYYLKGNHSACLTYEAMDKLVRYHQDNNYHAINRMILNGEAWMTTAGTRVRLLQVDLPTAMARVEETETGKIYLVPYEKVIK